MKTHPFPLRRRGFTLIELLVVIAIIAILAGLSMGGYSYVTRKQAEEQARVQISLLEKALEEYKLDNGEYPASQANGGTLVLYDELYKNGTGASPTGKIYLSELDPNNKGQGWVENTGGSVKIIDPFGVEYIYKTGADAKNPDFDLASKGKDGIIGTPDDIDNY